MNNKTYVKVKEEKYFALIKRAIREVMAESKQISQTVPIENDLLTTKKVEEILDVTPQTITAWKKKGILPFRSIGGRHYFLRSELTSFIKGGVL